MNKIRLLLKLFFTVMITHVVIISIIIVSMIIGHCCFDRGSRLLVRNDIINSFFTVTHTHVHAQNANTPRDIAKQYPKLQEALVKGNFTSKHNQIIHHIIHDSRYFVYIYYYHCSNVKKRQGELELRRLRGKVEHVLDALWLFPPVINNIITQYVV